MQPCGSPGVPAVWEDLFCDSSAWICLCCLKEKQTNSNFSGTRHVLTLAPSPTAQGSNFPNTRDIILSKPQGSQCNQSQRAWVNLRTKAQRSSNCDVSTAIIFVCRVAPWSWCKAGAHGTTQYYCYCFYS